MQNSSRRSVKSIRITDDLYHEARIAALISRKSAGQWIEEAIREKLGREPHPAKEKAL